MGPNDPHTLTAAGATIAEGGPISDEAHDHAKQINITGIPSARSLHQLPPVPRDFTGRERELSELIALVEHAP